LEFKYTSAKAGITVPSNAWFFLFYKEEHWGTCTLKLNELQEFIEGEMKSSA
jgi:hypothetical protein